MTDERLRYLPPGFDVPTSELQALQAARAIIAQDGRWCQGTEFDADTPTTKNPYCGNWQVCAVGAVRLVTMGVEEREHNLTHEKWWDVAFDRGPSTPEQKLFESTCNRLHEATVLYTSGREAEAALYETGEIQYHPIYESVVDKNDDAETKLDEMLDIFDLAIELLQKDEAA